MKGLRASGQKEYTSLLKGLITEASPLTFPEGATSDELNFLADKDGMLRKRRKGFASIYPNSVFNLPDINGYLENVMYWRGSGYVVFSAVYSGKTWLRLHAVDSNFTLFSTVEIADTPVSTQFAELTDVLVIALSNGKPPIVLEYDSVTKTIDVSKVLLHVRDFELVDDGLGISTRQSTIDNPHRYNILNAGWHVSKFAEGVSGNPKQSVITTYFDVTGFYPSNADIVSIGVITSDTGQVRFDPKLVEDAGLGNTVAPRGHYVFNIGTFDRNAKVANPAIDGAPSSTITSLINIDSSGAPTYGGGEVGVPPPPDEPEPPFEPWRPPGGEIP